MVFTVGPHFLQTRDGFRWHLRQDSRRRGCIIQRGRGDRHRQQQAQRIYENMAFSRRSTSTFLAL
jgi:hypothetical protein